MSTIIFRGGEAFSMPCLWFSYLTLVIVIMYQKLLHVAALPIPTTFRILYEKQDVQQSRKAGHLPSQNCELRAEVLSASLKWSQTAAHRGLFIQTLKSSYWSPKFPRILPQIQKVVMKWNYHMWEISLHPVYHTKPQSLRIRCP